MYRKIECTPDMLKRYLESEGENCFICKSPLVASESCEPITEDNTNIIVNEVYCRGCDAQWSEHCEYFDWEDCSEDEPIEKDSSKPLKEVGVCPKCGAGENDVGKDGSGQDIIQDYDMVNGEQMYRKVECGVCFCMWNEYFKLRKIEDLKVKTSGSVRFILDDDKKDG